MPEDQDIGAANETPAFLDPEPKPWVARAIASLLIGLFAATLIASFAIRVPETVDSSFVLVPLHGTDPVRAPRAGLVAEVRTRAGQPVAKGDPLFVLRSESVTDRSSEFATLEAQRTSSGEGLRLEQAKAASRRRADEEVKRQLESRLEDLDHLLVLKRKEYRITREVISRYDTLFEKGLVSHTEHLVHKLQANEALMDLQRLESERDEARSQLDTLGHEIEAREAEYAEAERKLSEELATRDIRIAALSKDLSRSAGNELSLPAPCAGTMLRLRIQSAGAYVAAGDVLGELACAGEPLQAELMIAQGDVALIEEGQGIKLLYDAFPYQRYGVRYGTLRWVSPASLEKDGKRVFRGLADTSNDPILARSKLRPLKPGMGGKARINIGRRTVISYVFEPLRSLRESLRVPPTAAELREEADAS